MKWNKKKTWFWFLLLYVTSGLFISFGSADDVEMAIEKLGVGFPAGSIDVMGENTPVLRLADPAQPGATFQDGYAYPTHDVNDPESKSMLDHWSQ